MFDLESFGWLDFWASLVSWQDGLMNFSPVVLLALNAFCYYTGFLRRCVWWANVVRKLASNVSFPTFVICLVNVAKKAMRESFVHGNPEVDCYTSCLEL